MESVASYSFAFTNRESQSGFIPELALTPEALPPQGSLVPTRVVPENGIPGVQGQRAETGAGPWPVVTPSPGNWVGLRLQNVCQGEGWNGLFPSL